MEKTNRRTFLKQAGLLSLFTIVPSKVLGGPGRIAPSDQLTKGIIGVGGIGRSSYQQRRMPSDIGMRLRLRPPAESH